MFLDGRRMMRQCEESAPADRKNQPTMSTVRIATETKTGNRYLAHQIEYGESVRVYCWGELLGFCQISDGWRLRHSQNLEFDITEVEIEMALVTESLLADLVRQTGFGSCSGTVTATCVS